MDTPPTSYITPPHMKELRGVIEARDYSAYRRFRAKVIAEGKAAQSTLTDEINQLQAMVVNVDALRLLGALHLYDARQRLLLSAAEMHGFDAMIEFFAGLVTSRPEEDVVPHIGEVVDGQLFLDIENKLRVIANHQMAVDLGARFARPSDSRIDDVIDLLRMERHFDRMAGFDPHLRRIAMAVFELVDDRAFDILGFRFSDAIRFADAYNNHLIERSHATAEWVESVHPPLPSDAGKDQQIQWMCTDMLMFVMTAAADLELEIDETLATEIGISTESFNRLVSAMATPLGSQQVADLHGDNTIRYKPIVQLSSGEWVWCRPGDFIHVALDWAFDVASASDPLRESFDAARQTVAERLPAEALESIFGERVHRNVTYPDAESDAEADALVALAGSHLLMECKGGRFTPPARRAAPGRVEKHAKQIVLKGADQNLRAAQAITKELPLVDGSNHRVEVSKDGLSLAIIVTLDRIDPFSTHLGRPSNDSVDDRSWIVPLADLLTIADILDTPSEFFAYAQKRVEMVRSDSHRVIVEADALGAWCEDRLASFKPLIPGAFVVVDKTSDQINDYFALQLLPGADGSGIDLPQRPTSGVPSVVLDSLERLLDANSPLWPLRCKQVFEVPPSEWKKLGPLLTMAANPKKITGRYARKRVEQARRGMTFGGKLPLRIVTATGQSTNDDNFLHVYV